MSFNISRLSGGTFPNFCRILADLSKIDCEAEEQQEQSVNKDEKTGSAIASHIVKYGEMSTP
jgi:hypothetical protein